MISRSNISKELTPNLGSAKRSNKMATRGTIEAQNKRAKMKKKLDKSKTERRKAYQSKPDDFSFMKKADLNRKEEDAKRKDIKKVRKKAAVVEGSGTLNTLSRAFQDAIKSVMPESIALDTSREMDKKVSDIGNRTKRRKRDKGFNFKDFTKGSKNMTKKAKGGMNRVGLSPAEEKKSGTPSEAARRRNMKKGGTTKLAAGGQGYSAREDESLGMRTGPERSKSQSMAARRDESYGDWGKRRRGRVNVKKGGSIGVALRGGGAVTR